MKPNLKLLHSADLHLGAKFVGLGIRGAEQRCRLRNALQDLAALAVTERVDALLLAGDTFDYLSPSPESIASFKRTLQILSEARIPVLVIAGTHDHLGHGAFLPQLETDCQGQFTLLTPERPVWRRHDGQLTVQGVSLLAADRPERPLAGVGRTEDPGWQVGLAHASLDLGNLVVCEALISPAEIAATGLDYLALGHWHGVRDCSQGNTVAWYSGPPEMIAWDEEQAGQALVIELADGQPAKVTPRRIGKRTFVRLTVEAEALESLLDRIRPSADPEAVLELVCSGIVPPEIRFNPEELKAAVASWFFHIRIKDMTSAEIPADELDRFPETTVIGRYIRLMQAELAAAGEDQQEDVRQALQLGLALLLGREVNVWS